MPEKLRVRCPVCGSMPDLDQLAKTEEEKPARIRIFLQKFGGKMPADEAVGVPYKKRKRGSAPGYMEYTDITDSSQEELAKLKEWFDKRVQEYLSE